jgi:hypothetical protein
MHILLCLRCAYAFRLLLRTRRQVEEGISKPLATLSKVAGNLPGATTLQGIMEDPDTKLLQSVAGSMRGATEKSIRDRCVWVCAVDLDQINDTHPANCCANCVQRPQMGHLAGQHACAPAGGGTAGAATARAGSCGRATQRRNPPERRRERSRRRARCS